MTILYREEVINICKKMKIYEKVKPQILAYFDDFIPEAENKLSDDIPDQNKKAEVYFNSCLKKLFCKLMEYFFTLFNNDFV